MKILKCFLTTVQKEILFYEEILIISIIFNLGSLILLSAKQGSVYIYIYIYIYIYTHLGLYIYIYIDTFRPIYINISLNVNLSETSWHSD
jgi:hypothetical protein